MKGFQFKSIRAKIIFGFLIVVILTGFYIGYNFIQNTKSNNMSKDIVERQLEILVADENIAAGIASRVSSVKSFIISGDEKNIANYNASTASMQEEVTKLFELLHIDKDKQHLQEIIDMGTAWGEKIEARVFDEYKKGNKEGATNNLGALLPDTEKLIAAFEELSDQRAERIRTLSANMIAANNQSILYGISLGFIILILSITLSLITANRISKPIHTVVARMVAMSKGDVSQPDLAITTQDEIGTLVNATNEMNQQLKNTLQSINAVSETVAANSVELAHSATEVKTGAEQITLTMQELADGAESQASHSGDLASIIDNFKTRIDEASNEGTSLTHNSNNVRALTEEGHSLMLASTKQMHNIDEIMNTAVVKVEGLNEQTKEISSLVSVIQDIADQTNLLALNAAIEAARAGENGKGFAVVAAEVRKLAEQVTFSVSDISAIVERIQNETGGVTTSLQEGYQEVKNGTEQVEATGATFDHISNAIDESARNIAVITANLTELVATTDEINRAIDDIAAVSEESAAGIEETTATIDETATTMDEISRSANYLAETAENLNHQMSHFKTE